MKPLAIRAGLVAAVAVASVPLVALIVFIALIGGAFGGAVMAVTVFIEAIADEWERLGGPGDWLRTQWRNAGTVSR